MSYIYKNRNSAWQKRRIKNAAENLFIHNEIKLVHAQAKKVQSYSEKLITLAKKGDLNSIRILKSKIYNRKLNDGKNVLYKITHDIAKKYKDRSGGYTKIIKLYNRLGDNSKIVLLKLV